MRVRTISLVAGIGSAALALAMVATGAATASSSSQHSLLASGGHGTASATPMAPSKAGKCGSGFGTELPTPDGVIAWNDTSGSSMDNAGAADVKCAKKTAIKKVSAYGYFGTASELFNVTVYGNSSTNEPDDSNVICSYSSLPGAAGGQYPTHVLTTLKLTSKCKLPKGTSWIAIQNNDASGPWYWEMQNEQSGSYQPDWDDVYNAFGSGCTVFSNGEYLSGCLGYTYGDWMLSVK